MKFLSGLAIAIALLACAATAQEEQPRIPDLSLSPEETNQLIANPPAHNPDYSPYGPNGQQYFSGHGSFNADSETAPHAARFMDSYCDQNVTPALGVADNCLLQEKQSICQRFQALPGDAQRVLDHAIECVYTSNNGDDPARTAQQKACNADDSDRLQLAKKYWQDQATSKALLLMPDEVLNSGKCMTGSH